MTLTAPPGLRARLSPLVRPPSAQERLRAPRAVDTARGWVTTLVVTAIAGVLRLWGVGWPREKIFDEVYYPANAAEILRQGYENSPGRLYVVHPPLGKWCIAIGIKIFGNNSYGWRVPTAIAGTIAVLILIRLVRRMTGSTMLGAIAGLLLSVDGLSLVMSRTSLLDIFQQPFILAGFACLVIDRDRVRERLAQAVQDGTIAAYRDQLGPRLGPRGWRLLGGVLLGASAAVKWNGVYFVAGFAILSIFWDRSARRSAGIRRPTRVTALLDLPFAIIALAIVPILSYLACWTGWFLGANGYDRHWSDTHPPKHFGFLPDVIYGPLRSLWHYHAEMLKFAESLSSYHPYRSQPWAWIVDGRPVNFYYPPDVKGCGSASCARQIVSLGTPALWWAFLPALLWMIWVFFSRWDWRAGAVLMAFLAGWATWLENTSRTMFFFYMTPLVPFLVIGVTLCLGDILGKRSDSETRYVIGLAIVCAYLAIVIINFAYLWPILTGQKITYMQWSDRMWLSSWI